MTPALSWQYINQYALHNGCLRTVIPGVVSGYAYFDTGTNRRDMRSNITELPDISLSGIYKTYGYQDNMTYALNNINLDVVKGEFLALCGPSGSGKSTLLNILSGIDTPTAGNVFFCIKSQYVVRQNLARLRSRHLGFIFQFFNLIPVLSVLIMFIIP